MPNAKSTAETRRRRGEKQKSEIVCCLCIDMIGSTRAGLSRTTQQNDKFNLAFVEQLWPHWEELVLGETLVKFTGDGWLVITTDVDQLPALCCLALIQAKRFQPEMSERTGTDPAMIPPLRMALCAGRDVSVTLPNGQLDWVGDSVRRAVRAAEYCGPLRKKTRPNEILVDDTVRLAVQRDFHIEVAEIAKRVSAAKQSEEPLVLHLLVGLKLETCFQSDAPPHFIYTLGRTGMAREAEKEVERRIKQGATDATDSRKGEKHYELIARRERIIGDLNTMISKLPYPSVCRMVDRMKAKKLTNLWTFNILNSKKKLRICHETFYIQRNLTNFVGPQCRFGVD